MPGGIFGRGKLSSYGSPRFFGQGSEGYIRICFATSRGILEEGLNRLEQGIRMLMEEKGLH